MNACSWKPSLVTIADGSQVLSDSEEWRAFCEARYFLARHPAERPAMLAAVGQRRGADALATLQANMLAAEPDYVLSLPNKGQRNAYLRIIAGQHGDMAAEHLKARAMALHAERAASNCEVPAS